MNLETDDPEKGQLLQKSAHHRELLEEEVKLISERSEKILTNALIIGGTLAFTYMLVRSLSSSSPEKQKHKPKKIKLVASREGSEPAFESNSEPEEAGIVSQIGAVLVAQATGFLLSLAREKLVEFLQSQNLKKENTNEHS
jgi:hypothetical protein